MKILSKKKEIVNQIDTLYQKVESFKKEQSLKYEELSGLRSALSKSKEALSEAINNIYARNTIEKSIAEFYTLLNNAYVDKYNVKLVEDEGKFKCEFYKKIQNNSVESIFKPMKFKHNSVKLKIIIWLVTIFLSALAILFFFLAHEFGRTLTHNIVLEDHWEYNLLGICLIIIGVFVIFLALGTVLSVNLVQSMEVLSLIQNEQNQNFRKQLNYLNSLHKLPQEIKLLIK